MIKYGHQNLFSPGLGCGSAGPVVVGSQGGHSAFDPVQEVADLGVDPVLVGVGTAFAPANHPCQEPGLAVLSDQWTAAVTLAGVLPSGFDTSTEHVPGDVKTGVTTTLLQGHPGDLQAL